MQKQVYLGLGSNQGNKLAHLQRAVAALRAHPQICVKRASSLYGSTPVGLEEQEDFLNAVLFVETSLAPTELMQATKNMEAESGRQKGIHWGPRTLDIDLLLYEDQIIKTEKLNIPHKEMEKRSFVLVPLLELNCDIIIPGLGKAANFLPHTANKDVWLLAGPEWAKITPGRKEQQSSKNPQGANN